MDSRNTKGCKRVQRAKIGVAGRGFTGLGAGAALGAAMGAIVGSIIPEGTAVGAALGIVIGGVLGCVAGGGFSSGVEDTTRAHNAVREDRPNSEVDKDWPSEVCLPENGNSEQLSLN